MVRHNPAPAGLTLVELILATALSAMVLVAVFTAIEVQLQAFARGTQRTEQARLAHVLLRRMAADLRGTLGPPSSEQQATDDSLDDSDFTSRADPFDQPGEMGWDFGSEGTASGPIGLQGEADRLRIDVVRAVRGDSEASVMAFWSDGAPSPADSGIRTIEYFVVEPDVSLRATGWGETDGSGGLVRRELIEPVAAWASELGMLEAYDPAAPPLAPEVVAVEFRYHDGSDWLDAWDSSSMGALPRAVEITLLLVSADTADPDPAAPSLDLGLSADADSELRRYRLVVNIPAESPEQPMAGADMDDWDPFAAPLEPDGEDAP